MSKRHGWFFAVIIVGAASQGGWSSAHAADDKISVDKLKKQYWAQSGNFEVVQNRLYSKASRFELGLFGAFPASDPFLSVHALGGSLGYHFTEFFSMNFLGWKSFAKGSTALEVLEHDIHATANTNLPRGYYGLEASASTIYGKLSLLGQAILYYDLHFLAGLGMTSTENGNNITEHVGIGQEIFASHYMTVRIDYRLMHYREKIIAKSTATGQALGSVVTPGRDNWTNALTLGLSFFFP